MLSKLWSPLDQGLAGKRGGWRQRIQRAALDSIPETVKISRLAAGQLLVWADGGTSASQLQTVMQDAVTDGLQHPMVSRLSGIQSGQHAHGSLMHLLKENTAALDDICPVPGSAQDQMLPLSSIIRRLYQYYPTEFVHRLGADVGRTRSFWD